MPEVSYKKYAFQRIIMFRITVSVLLTVLLLTACVVYFLMLPTDATSETANIMGILVLLFLLSCAYLISQIVYQEKVKGMLQTMVVIWRYNPRFLYRFRRQMAARKPPIAAGCFLLASFITGAIAVFIAVSPDPSYAWLFYTAAGIALLCAVLLFPPVGCRVSHLFFSFFGKDDCIIICRRGTVQCGGVLDFGFNSTTFFNAAVETVGTYPCFCLRYHRKKGASINPRRLPVPIPPDTSQEELDELLKIFNSASLFINEVPTYLL